MPVDCLINFVMSVLSLSYHDIQYALFMLTLQIHAQVVIWHQGLWPAGTIEYRLQNRFDHQASVGHNKSSPGIVLVHGNELLLSVILMPDFTDFCCGSSHPAVQLDSS